jgi:hypothetical protein
MLKGLLYVFVDAGLVDIAVGACPYLLGNSVIHEE